MARPTRRFDWMWIGLPAVAAGIGFVVLGRGAGVPGDGARVFYPAVMIYNYAAIQVAILTLLAASRLAGNLGKLAADRPNRSPNRGATPPSGQRLVNSEVPPKMSMPGIDSSISTAFGSPGKRSMICWSRPISLAWSTMMSKLQWVPRLCSKSWVAASRPSRRSRRRNAWTTSSPTCSSAVLCLGLARLI